MSKFNYTMSQKEINELLNKGGEVYKMKPHTWKPLKGVGKNYCPCCGLVGLRNKMTEWSIELKQLSDVAQYLDTL